MIIMLTQIERKTIVNILSKSSSIIINPTLTWPNASVVIGRL